MSALTPDYDTDPGRSRAVRLGWQQDVHAPVAERLIAEAVEPVLDVGCGLGRLRAALGDGRGWVGIDQSPRQLADCPYRPVVQAHAAHLPLTDASVGAVTMLWMLYHLDEPRHALREAMRVLRVGGLLIACTNSRTSDPELAHGGYPPTTFDAEEASEIVADVFGMDQTDAEYWDAPLLVLEDRQAVIDYARSHFLAPEVVDSVTPPLSLTKRGCLVWARRL